MTKDQKPLLTAGIDVGSSAIKVAVLRDGGPGKEKILALGGERVRRRDPLDVVETTLAATLEDAGVSRDQLDYLATTGEGEVVSFRTGHFYGMTTHARGGLFLDPEVRSIVDIGALHTRAVLMDEHAKVLGYRMTSQCASGSGQFLENICRYLGVTIDEVGPLSCEADDPEACSSICAVLAETDVINMVSRGITIPNILKGIHQSMAGRYMRLLTSTGATGTTLVTGGLANDIGLLEAMRERAAEQGVKVDIRAHEHSVLAGALGAALWGGFRARKLKAKGVALVGNEKHGDES
ncbi:MAG: benzoyl-CoA reductase subunit D [Planctomycetota bacterium]|jgi:benzoyl-CoA reductase subunit D